VGRLLKEGIVEEEEEEPLLCLAARLGHKECVMELLNFGKGEPANSSLDLNQEDRSGFSPLVLAVYGGHTDVVVALTKRCLKWMICTIFMSFSGGWMSTSFAHLVPLPLV